MTAYSLCAATRPFMMVSIAGPACPNMNPPTSRACRILPATSSSERRYRVHKEAPGFA